MLAGRPVTNQLLYFMDPRYRNLASYFVYPNDAADIKAHPFFRGIQWSELHKIQPPLIPRVKNWEDTRYFDEWKSVGNLDEPSLASESEGTDEDLEEGLGVGLEENFDSALNSIPADPDTAEANALKTKDAEKRKERKRPRDKILRDKKLGRAALEIRKRGAFLGYTYRRPKGPAVALTSDRGRRTFARGQLAELYAI